MSIKTLSAVALCVAGMTGIFLSEAASAAKPGYSRSSTRYTAPARPRIVNRTTVNKTTIVQQRVVNAGNHSGGASSWLAPAAGALGGSMLGSWLMRPSEQPQPQQEVMQAQPEASTVTEPACDATRFNCQPLAK